MMEKRRVRGPTRPSVSPQRVGYDRISLRRASLRRKIATHRLGIWEISAALLGGVRFSLTLAAMFCATL